MTVGPAFRNVADVARATPLSSKPFSRIFNVQAFEPACKASPELHRKYGTALSFVLGWSATQLVILSLCSYPRCFSGVAIDNVQEVIAVQNVVTSGVTWWNPSRKTKPQNFTATTTAQDPTVGTSCDFCEWERFTAVDTFGRIERRHAVSASNLFKYGAPAQGIVLFKHHDPLNFSKAQVLDLLTVADGWFHAAAASVSTTKYNIKEIHPYLVWNCLARAGASQYHGHAQVMMSAVPMPAMAHEAEAVRRYATQYCQGNITADYYADLKQAHADVGLARSVTLEQSLSEPSSTSGATAFASLCPTKDAEIVVHGSSLTCPAFQSLVYAALRALVDELGVQSFNVGIHNISLRQEEFHHTKSDHRSVPVIARVVSRGRANAVASDFGGLEVFGGASIGHTNPWDVIHALETVLIRLNLL